MSFKKYQSGFTLVELIIILAVVGVIGLTGYFLYNRQATPQVTKSETTQSASANDVQAAPEINSTSDLDKASTALDQTDTSSSSDSAELESQLEAF